MTQLEEKIARLRLLRAEQDRLLETLLYYEWLKEHGVEAEQVVGHSARPVPLSPVLRAQLRKAFPQLYISDTPVLAELAGRPSGPRAAIFYTLKDGTEIGPLPWPPFTDNVIYNQSLLPQGGPDGETDLKTSEARPDTPAEVGGSDPQAGQ